MSVQQISIFLENRPGRLVTVARVLGNAGVSILALSVADTKDFGILRLIVNRIEDAEKALHDADILCQINEVTAVEIASTPGSLASVLELFTKVGVNVEYMYAIAEPCSEHPVMIFRFNHPKLAIQAMTDAQIHVCTFEEILNQDRRA